jgi:hypothetical protein
MAILQEPTRACGNVKQPVENVGFAGRRARSSAGERSLHTREVGGSKPPVPIKTKGLQLQAFSRFRLGFFRGPNRAHESIREATVWLRRPGRSTQFPSSRRRHEGRRAFRMCGCESLARTIERQISGEDWRAWLLSP